MTAARMDRNSCVHRVLLTLATATLVGGGVATQSALAIDAPGWWRDANRGAAELVYEKGSAEKRATEGAARAAARENALAGFRARISDDAAVREGITLVGTEMPFEDTAKDALGRWYAWVLVSYPRESLEKAIRRAREGVGGGRRASVLVCPLAFGRESEEQFPEVVARYRAAGYGNAIWQTVEDLLYEEGYATLTAPSSKTADLLREVLGGPEGGEDEWPATRPDYVLLCNMNFFEIRGERLSLARRMAVREYHVELLLELYDTRGEAGKGKIPARGDARSADLLEAATIAARQAVSRLVARLREAGG